MSVHATSWAWQQQVGDKGAKLVLLKLADQANDDFEAWPSRKTLARECELGDGPAGLQAVKRALRHLRDAGFIEIEERRDPSGRQTSNTYRILGRGTQVTPSPGVMGDPPEGAVGDPPEGVMGDPLTTLNRQEEPSEGTAPAASAAEHQRLVDDALRQAVYGDPSVRLNRREARKVAIAATHLRQAGATPEQVLERAEAYRRHKTYGECALTAPSLVEHWSELAPAKRKASAAPCAECGVGGGRHLAECTKAALAA